MGKAVKTTRNKIMKHLQKAIDRCDEILLDFRAADDLAAGNHPLLTQYLPSFVESVDSLKQGLIAFRELI